MLRRYAEALEPWARATAQNMLNEVNQADYKAWVSLSNKVSSSLRDEVLNAPIGDVMRQLLDEQVTLIKSLPLEAAKRVHELTIKGLEDSTRAKEIAREIYRTGEVTQSRAMLIARTEVARTASKLTEARSKYVGATHYIWRTSHDSDVRSDHRMLDGKVFAWSDPPVADQHSGARAHPGQIYNCRCWPEIILTDD